MAGAYSAVVSVMTVMDNLKLHPHPPITLHPQQAESLTQNLTFLEEFVENYDQTLPYTTEADPFESRIADAAYAAEDAIESHIVDRIKGDGDAIESQGWFRRMCRRLGHRKKNTPTRDDLFCHTPAPGKGFISSHAKATEEADAAYAAEDAIESHIADHINSSGGSLYSSRSTSVAVRDPARGEGISSSSSDASLYEALEKVIEEMSLIQKEAIEIKQTMAVGVLHAKSTPMDSLRSSSVSEKTSMVGADHLLLRLKENLVSDYCRDLQTIPVVGMGGTGKTTLAINIFQDRLINEHFDIRAWATISQQYSIPEILVQVLRGLNIGVDKDSSEDASIYQAHLIKENFDICAWATISQQYSIQEILVLLKEQKLGGDNKHLSEDALGEILYKYLFGRRYLIVMDDMWSIEVWDGIRRFLPDSRNGSRIVITTRLSNLASGLPNSSSLEMKLLDETSSWDLLSKTVFGEEGCPLELEEIGKEIGKSCKGLPLSILVIGGFLAKSKRTRKVWKNIEENLSVIANLKYYELSLKILYMSYRQLPIYLKPCFLYMGVFPEDDVIKISTLVKLWVAEGFIKPVSGESTLEDIARLYLKDLADRNLILIDEISFKGNIKSCKIHDLLRELCLREAEKERFYTLTRQGMVHGQRRIVINNTASKNVIKALPSMSPVRSLFWNLKGEGLPAPNLRLLRIFHSPRFRKSPCTKIVASVHQFVNSRFLHFSIPKELEFPLSIWKFWNLQTLIVDYRSWKRVNAPNDIWYMSHIRHLLFSDGIDLPDPPKDQDDIVLGNLQTLVVAINCSHQVATRIPNLKKLKTSYVWGSLDKFCQTNLNGLEKLESLDCGFFPSSQMNFPDSLKKLCVKCVYCREQELLDKIGSLPFLEKLQLQYWSFEDGKWETTEGQFRSLKSLILFKCKNLKVWTIESSHFPCLSRLRLHHGAEVLEEFPLELAEISTLRVIEVNDCIDSAVVSLKRIVDENEELNGEADLHVQISLRRSKEEIPESKTTLEGLTGLNFHIKWQERSQWPQV